MTRFRKRPVVIDAERFNADGEFMAADDPRWPAGVVPFDPAAELNNSGAVKTLKGWLKASPGDWIITGVKGERYPCKPDTFTATYEPAEAPAHAD